MSDDVFISRQRKTKVERRSAYRRDVLPEVRLRVQKEEEEKKRNTAKGFNEGL